LRFYRPDNPQELSVKANNLGHLTFTVFRGQEKPHREQSFFGKQKHQTNRRKKIGEKRGKMGMVGN